MPGLYLEWGADLVISQQGGLVLAQGWDEIQQRIVRRILTSCQLLLPDNSIAPADYIYDPSYGLSLRALVKEVMTDEQISNLKQRITQGILEDSEVDKTITPQITIDQPTLEQMRVHVLFRTVSGEDRSISFE